MIKRRQKIAIAIAIVLAVVVIIFVSEFGFLFKTSTTDIGIDYSDRYKELYGKKGLTQEERDYMKEEERRVQDEALRIYRSKKSKANREPVEPGSSLPETELGKPGSERDSR